MIIAECSYSQFKNLKTLFGVKFSVLVQDATPDGGKFTMLANDGGCLVMRCVADTKPGTFDFDFPLAVLVSTVSI